MNLLPAIRLILLCSAAAAQDAGVQPDGLKNLRHPDANVRYRAAAVLAEQGPRAKFAIAELRAALGDDDPLVRVKVAEALWLVERPAPSAILPTLRRALSHADPRVRSAACGVVGLMGAKGKNAVPALIATVKDKDLAVIVAAVTALGDVGPPAADSAGTLLQLSAYGEFALLEPIVGAALGNMGEDVVPELTAALKSPAIERRRVAAYALGSIGPPARKATTALDRLLRDDRPALRFLAARALGAIGKDARAALPRLQDATSDKDAAVRIRAALAVWQIAGDASHVPLLAAALRENSPAAREAAAQALATIGKPARTAARALRPLLKDMDKELRAHAAFALWRVSGDANESVPALRALLTDEARVQADAVEKLGQMGPAARDALPELVTLYREQDSAPVRRSLGAAIKNIDVELAGKLGIR